MRIDLHRIAATSLLLAGVAPVAAQVVPEKSAILERVERLHGAIETLQVTFEYPEAGADGHHVVAELTFLGGQHMVVDGGHGWNGVSWRNFYARSRSYVIGQDYDVDWPNKLAFERRKLRDGERIERFEVQGWVRASGYWPDDASLPEPEMYGVSLGLRTPLRDDRYVVEGRTESACAAECVVLSRDKVDRLWLDPTRGFALRKRVIHAADELAMEITVEELEEFAGGLFLPKAYRIRVYCNGGGQPLDQPVDMPSIVHATTLNSLSPESFKLELRPGALRFNRADSSKIAQTEPGGLGFLLREAQLERAVVSMRSDGAVGWLWVVVLAVGSCLGAWFLPAVRLQRERQAGFAKDNAAALGAPTCATES